MKPESDKFYSHFIVLCTPLCFVKEGFVHTSLTLSVIGPSYQYHHAVLYLNNYCFLGIMEEMSTLIK